jgi:hypothetical protein
MSRRRLQHTQSDGEKQSKLTHRLKSLIFKLPSRGNEVMFLALKLTIKSLDMEHFKILHCTFHSVTFN